MTDDRHEIEVVDDGSSSGAVQLRSVRFVDGVDMSGPFVFDRDSVEWLLEELVLADDAWGYRGADHQLGGDHFFVQGGGTDSRPIINLQNERSGTPEPGVYALGMTLDVAARLRQLLDDL